MADVDTAERRSTRVARWGDSLAVRIPQPLADQAQLGEGDEVEVVAEGHGAITIRRRSADEELARLVAGITPENLHEETDWGPAQGREVW